MAVKVCSITIYFIERYRERITFIVYRYTEIPVQNNICGCEYDALIANIHCKQTYMYTYIYIYL